MDRAKVIYDELKKAGVRFLTWLPDSETHFMHDVMMNDRDIKLIQVCREGEAAAICAGVYMGGAKGALLVESQGMFEFGNVLKWAAGLNIPFVMLIGYLFFKGLKRTPQGMMRGNQKDYTEPFLDAFDIKHYLVESDADVAKVGLACREAWETKKPVAVLLTSADDYVPGT